MLSWVLLIGVVGVVISASVVAFTVSAVTGCGQYTNATAPGFASVARKFSTGSYSLFDGLCNNSQVTAVAGGSSNTIIYKTGYVWNAQEQTWNPFTFSGSFVAGSTAWINGAAQAWISIANPGTYAVAYVCESSQAQWKCGCTDQQCSQRNLWTLQRFVPGSGGGEGGGDDDDGLPTGPAIAFSASPTTLPAAGGIVTLTWTSGGATSCSASGGWNGTREIIDSEEISINTSTSFIITCVNTGGGETVKSVFVQVGSNSGRLGVNRSGLPWATGVLGTTPTGMVSYEKWIGYKSDVYGTFTDKDPDTWEDLRGGSNPSSTVFQGVLSVNKFREAIASVPKDTPVIISYPMIPKSHSNVDCKNPAVWDQFARGDFDQHYRILGQKLKGLADSYDRDVKDFVLRLGWEMNGEWYHWSVCEKVPEFKTSWKRAISAIREGAPGIKVDWSPSLPYFNRKKINGGAVTPTPQGAPDPAYYDIVSVSMHLREPDVVNDATWNVQLNGNNSETGLQPMMNLAKANGKKFALTEWGVQMEDGCEGQPKNANPAFAISKVWDFLYANRQYVSHDTMFSPSCHSLFSRPTSDAAQQFKSTWGPGGPR
mgnify:FL=1